MSESAVAPSTDTTTAPEGYISVNKILSVALAAKAKHGMCDAVDEILTKDLGIKLPAAPNVRLTLEIPGDLITKYDGLNWQQANEDGTIGVTDREVYGMNRAVWAAIRVAEQQVGRVDDYRDSVSSAAKAVVDTWKIEVVSPDSAE